MVTYYHGNPEIQNDGLQTLILMNPGYVNYSDAQQHHQSNANTFVFPNSLNLPHAPPSHTPHQYITGVPLHAPFTAVASQDIQNQCYIPRAVEYNLWNSFEPATAAREITRAQSNEGLSLTLSSRQPIQTTEYGGYRGERDLRSQGPETEGLRISGGSSSSPVSGFSSGVSGLQQSVLLSSKYLTAAQQLLDEVVNVGNDGVKADTAKKRGDRFMGESSVVSPRDGLSGGEFAGGKGGCSAELSSVERQEIQMKKAKLIGMLDEVDQRYRQYRQQMQVVMSMFEQVAGIGSAKSYTALALQTISKQFRCLKDAISSQIRTVNKCLGEEDSPSAGSRLKFVDNQLRQQRALQQLGMIQPNAWRPQRGLPERSVSVLRAWLFEHFLHPYPKDSDKHLLAKQTGLTRSQVSNWFINARVRLWKPMVEEMYMEEIKEQEHNLSEQDKATKTGDDSIHETSSSKHQEKNPSADNNQSMTTFMSTQHNNPNPLIPISTASTYSSFSPKKPRNASETFMVPTMDIDIKPVDCNDDDHRHQQQLQHFVPGSYMGGYSSYSPMGGGDMGRFDGSDQFSSSSRFMGNAVSLTLGLPHRDGFQGIEMGRTGMEMGVDASNYNTTMSTNNVFEDLGLPNGKRFAAQQLHDFVA